MIYVIEYKTSIFILEVCSLYISIQAFQKFDKTGANKLNKFQRFLQNNFKNKSYLTFDLQQQQRVQSILVR